MKAKNYMLTTKSTKNTAIAGITTRDFSMDDFRDALFNSNPRVISQSRIASKSHVVKTVHEMRKALNSYDDKRYQLDCVQSLPYGHYKTY